MQKIYIVEDDKNIAEIEQFALKKQDIVWRFLKMQRILKKK